MRMSVRWAVAMLVVAAPLLAAAQSLEGVWKGQLKAGRGFAVTVKFAHAGSSWTGELGTEESAEKRPLEAISFEKNAVRFGVPALGAQFSGQLAADGSSITGNWTQGAVSTPLSLSRDKAAEEVTTASDSLKPMAKDALPKFEVATIKPSNPENQNQGFHLHGQHLYSDNETLKDMLIFGFAINPSTIVNLHGWMTTERYDVDGRSDTPGVPNLAQMQSVYKDLLLTRFGLKYHMEKKEIPVFVLERGNGPLKITKSLGDPNGVPDTTETNHASESVTMRETNVAMKDFLLTLNYYLDRPTIERTGLEGRYDFVLTWAPNDLSEDANATAKVPNIFGALAELGLKLRGAKEPYDVMVIDHVERPSAN
jgi:uncharacterized protein (TIGR03435 family)